MPLRGRTWNAALRPFGSALAPPARCGSDYGIATYRIGKTLTKERSSMPATLKAPARAATVLVVDDDPDLRTVLRLLLEDEGYIVQLAGDGFAALARVQAETPDLI